MKLTIIILIGFLAYIVIGSILPNLKKINITEQTKEQLDEKTFTKDTTGVDRAALIAEATEALNIRMEMVRAAEHTIDIVMYKIVDSESTRAFFGEVYDAAERGVKVNLLVNGLTYLFYGNQSYMTALSTHENITGRIYNPVNLFKPGSLQNLMHDKMILIDDRYLLLGGRNVDERHFRPNGYSKSVAHDLEVFVVNTKAQGTSSSVIIEVRQYIQKLYDYKRTKRVKAKDRTHYIQKIQKAKAHYPLSNPQFYQKSLADFIEKTVATNKITFIHNPITAKKKEPTLGYQLRKLALNAQKSVIIQTPYITGNQTILSTLRHIAQRVTVTVQTNSPASTPNFFAYSNYYGQRQKMIKTNAAIYELQSTDSVHKKTFVIDDHLSMIGTFNMDDRSLYINTEVMLVIDSEPLTAELIQEAKKFQKQSLKLKGTNEYEMAPSVEEVPASFLKKSLLWASFVLLKSFQFLL